MKDLTTKYGKNNEARKVTFEQATEALIGHFVGLGDTIEAAETKAKQVGAQCLEADTVPYLKFLLGIDSEPLALQVEASALAFMDATAKAVACDIIRGMGQQ